MPIRLMVNGIVEYGIGDIHKIINCLLFIFGSECRPKNNNSSWGGGTSDYLGTETTSRTLRKAMTLAQEQFAAKLGLKGWVSESDRVFCECLRFVPRQEYPRC